MLEKGLIEKWAIEDWNAYHYTSKKYGWHYTHFTQDEMQRMCQKIIKENYFSIRFLRKNIGRLVSSPRDLYFVFRAGYQFAQFIRKKT